MTCSGAWLQNEHQIIYDRSKEPVKRKLLFKTPSGAGTEWLGISKDCSESIANVVGLRDAHTAAVLADEFVKTWEIETNHG